jgi:uncharacterized protein YjbJ (UPF0337 family)
MITEMMQGRWHRIKGAIQQGWGRLTSHGVSYLRGKKTALDGKLEERSARKGTSKDHELQQHLHEAEWENT